MIAAHLIEPGMQGYKLDDLSVQNLGYTMMPITDLIGEGKTQQTMDQIFSTQNLNHIKIEVIRKRKN